jgi:uncharacterized protein involved in tolerance to divalent cations
MKTDFVELVVTCGSWQEAQAIADSLLEKNLVNSVEILEIRGDFGHIDRVKLLATTTTNDFAKVEKLVTKLTRSPKLITN